MLTSNSPMLARKPAAILAALAPTTPPPRIVMWAGSTPGTPPSRMPRPICGPFEILGPFLDAHPPGDFAHRRQERQPALVVAERFVGHGTEPVCSSPRSACGRRRGGNR